MRYKSHHKKATTAPTTVPLEESIKSRTFEVGANTNSSARAGRNGTSPTLTSIFGIFMSQIRRKTTWASERSGRAVTAWCQPVTLLRTRFRLKCVVWTSATVKNCRFLKKKTPLVSFLIHYSCLEACSVRSRTLVLLTFCVFSCSEDRKAAIDPTGVYLGRLTAGTNTLSVTLGEGVSHFKFQCHLTSLKCLRAWRPEVSGYQIPWLMPRSLHVMRWDETGREEDWVIRRNVTMHLSLLLLQTRQANESPNKITRALKQTNCSSLLLLLTTRTLEPNKPNNPTPKGKSCETSRHPPHAGSSSHEKKHSYASRKSHHKGLYPSPPSQFNRGGGIHRGH